MLRQTYPDGLVEACVRLALTTLIRNDLEGVNDRIAGIMTGSAAGLSAISYSLAQARFWSLEPCPWAFSNPAMAHIGRAQCLQAPFLPP